MGALATLAERWSSLGRVTRVLLTAYGVYIPAAWIVGTAPGEVAFEDAEVLVPAGTLAAATRVHRADDARLLVELGPEPATIGLLDPWSMASDGTAQLQTAPRPVGRVHGAVRRDDGVHVLSETDDGARTLLRFAPDGGPVTVTAAQPTALWPLPDGTAFGHGLTDFLVHDAWGLHPSGRPAVLSGPLALVRVARGQPDPQGLWPQLPESRDDDLMLLDSENADPLGWLDTVRLVDISPAPSIPGFLAVIEDFPSLVLCDDDGCREQPLHIRTDSHPVLHLDHCDATRRIAACTPTELYLYEGHPTEDAVVFLGRAPLPAPCTSMAILDDITVLVTTDAGPRLVRFGEAGDD